LGPDLIQGSAATLTLCQGDTPLERGLKKVFGFAVSNAVSNYIHNSNQNQINH
jgi:hypothetical protein